MPGLSQQHVVGESEDDGDAHLAQHGQREALLEQQRQQDHHRAVSPQISKRRTSIPLMRRSSRLPHRAPRSPSRLSVPISPVGRTMSISTMSRYGRTGAVWAIVIDST